MISLKNVFCFLVFCLFISCDTTGKTEKEKDDLLAIETDSSTFMFRYRTNVFVMPSAHQTTQIIKQNNIQFDEKLINPVTNINQYSSSFKKAVNLGIYGTDMGYLSLFDQKQQALEYFITIKQLAEDLQLVDVVNENTMQRIERNLNNEDSIIVILTDMFKSIDNFLLQNNQEAVAVLAIAGSWIESVHIAFRSFSNVQSEELKMHLINQKYPLEKLISLLAPYYNQNENFTELINRLTDIAYEFDCIDIEQQYNEPKLNHKERTAIITSETKTMTYDYDLNRLTQRITNLRNMLTN
jgi:hypothetical protein